MDKIHDQLSEISQLKDLADRIRYPYLIYFETSQIFDWPDFYWLWEPKLTLFQPGA